MGAGIVEVFARAGFSVTAIEIDDVALQKGRGHLEKSLARAVSKGKLTEEEQSAILARVQLSTVREELRTADFVVEAVPERIDIKREVFTDLDRICRPGTILATNTSSLSVTEIAALTGRPSRVVGLHFFNPAPVMNLVEVVSTVVTDPVTVDIATEVAKRIGKTPVAVTDRAGFVANALLVPYLNHAIELYERKLAAREEIDAALTEDAGLPMGPLTLLDLVGLDVCLAVMDVLWDEFREPRYAAAPLLRRMVTAGLLGRKSGRGFYAYGADAENPADALPAGPLAVQIRERTHEFGLADLLLVRHIDDALRMVGDGYATADDVDTAMRLGCGYPKGPIGLLEERGAGALADALGGIANAHLIPAYDPAPLLAHLIREGKDDLRAS